MPITVVSVASPNQNTRVYTNSDGTIFTLTGGSVAWRNNNPGNIKWYSDSWAIANGAIGKDPKGFAIFPSYQAGEKALNDLVTGKYYSYTINSMMSSYAPGFENDTAAYQAFLSNIVGVSGTTLISSLTPEQLTALKNGIVTYEGTIIGAVTPATSGTVTAADVVSIPPWSPVTGGMHYQKITYGTETIIVYDNGVLYSHDTATGTDYWNVPDTTTGGTEQITQFADGQLVIETINANNVSRGVSFINSNGQAQGDPLPNPANLTLTQDYLASLAEFIRTEMGGNDAAIVNATEIRTLTGAQGGNEVTGIGGALELGGSDLANWYTRNEALYAYNVANGITAPGDGAPYNPAPYQGIADLIAGGQTPDIGLGILPGFTASPSATFLTFGSGGSSANVCLAPYATAPAWDANAPQAIAPPAANSYGYYGPNFSSFPFDPYLYYNNSAGNDYFSGPVYAPVVLDLDGDGIELIGKADSRAYYDVKGDGYKHNIGWAGADDGFLAIDTDGDGVISAANELSFALWTTDSNDIGSKVAANDAVCEMRKIA